MKRIRYSILPSNPKQNRKQRRSRHSGRALHYERLESRELLSITQLQSISTSQDTGEKPQSKIFEYAGQWWTVMPNSTGTWVYRLDGNRWTTTTQITSSTSVHADVKVDGNLIHVLLYNGTKSQVATLQYDGGPVNRFEPWTLQPNLVNVSLSSGVETATIEVDSTGRMWIASDVKNTVEVRYSDGLYTSWSNPITLGTGISSDDISAIVAMPNHEIGVMWSNQNTERFGFRVHVDGTDPTQWSNDEVPASQSALNVGGGMADDHIHLAVAADGTLYAAVKTSYDKSGYPKMALLVRRPNGSWDNLYDVDGNGTRPVVVVDDAAGEVIMAYESKEGGGDLLYRETPLGAVDLSPVQTMIKSSVANVTTTKVTSTNSVVFMASGKSVLFTFDTVTPPTNMAPAVSAGVDQTGVLGTPVALVGSASDDGLPAPPTLHTQWSVVSGPGDVSFDNDQLTSTPAAFSAAGTYVLRLTADDGQLSSSDDVSIVVSDVSNPPPTNHAPVVSAGADQAGVLGTPVALVGSASDDGLPSPPALTTHWTVVSGPGTVAFDNDQLASTSATFSAAGTYVLRLTADDGQLSAFDDMSIIVSDSGSGTGSGGPPQQIAFQNGLFPNVSYVGSTDTKIAAKKSTKNYGNDTKLTIDGSPDEGGLFRWDISSIPAGSTVQSVTVELNVTGSSKNSYDVFALDRAWEELSATWQRYATGSNWAGAGASGVGDADSAVLGEISAKSKGIYQIDFSAAGIAAVQNWIDNPSQNYGIIIKDYTQSKAVEVTTSEYKTASLRPKLIINFTPPQSVNNTALVGNLRPVVNVGPDLTVAHGQPLLISGAVSDDGQPASGAPVALLWTKVSGPGTVTFGDDHAADTTALFSDAGTYVLRLSANDSLLTGFDELTVSVS
ncbi:MAG TPA: DNRLRE domain-containing protein [Lacipirellulaceae bacterium]|nr:DNRLRE domain-containing protein [Lacipirellulaceae bacterium]